MGAVLYSTEVKNYIFSCRDDVSEIRHLVVARPSADDAEIAAVFTSKGYPRLALKVPAAIRREINEGVF